MTVGADKTWRGYMVYILRDNGWKSFVMSYYNGKYHFCGDYTYAKKFSEATAKKHIERIKERYGGIA